MSRVRVAGIVTVVALATGACSSSKQLAVGATTTTTLGPTSTTVAATSTSVVDTTTSAPTSTVIETTTTATVAPTTVAPTTVAPTTIPPPPPVVTRPIAAIDASGDAVIVAPNGTLTLLYDGPDPDDPPPSEGEVVHIDGVAVTADQSRAFIGVCCEPVAGSLLSTTPPAVATPDTSVFGHDPVLSPDGTKLVRVVYDAIMVTDTALNPIAGATYDVNIGLIITAALVDDDTVVAIIAGPTGTILQSFDLDGTATLVPVTTSAFSSATWTSELPWRFAGWADGIFYLTGATDGSLAAYGSDTLSQLGDLDRPLPAGALSVWFQDNELRWVDANRKLHVGGLIVPGEFIWVR